MCHCLHHLTEVNKMYRCKKFFVRYLWTFCSLCTYGTQNVNYLQTHTHTHKKKKQQHTCRCDSGTLASAFVSFLDLKVSVDIQNAVTSPASFRPPGPHLTGVHSVQKQHSVQTIQRDMWLVVCLLLFVVLNGWSILRQQQNLSTPCETTREAQPNGVISVPLSLCITYICEHLLYPRYT